MTATSDTRPAAEKWPWEVIDIETLDDGRRRIILPGTPPSSVEGDYRSIRNAVEGLRFMLYPRTEEEVILKRFVWEGVLGHVRAEAKGLQADDGVQRDAEAVIARLASVQFETTRHDTGWWPTRVDVFDTDGTVVCVEEILPGFTWFDYTDYVDTRDLLDLCERDYFDDSWLLTIDRPDDDQPAVSQ